MTRTQHRWVAVTCLHRGIQRKKKVRGEGKCTEEGTIDEAMEKRWRERSDEVLSGRKAWRLAHPKATFGEIEEAVHERVSRLEAQMWQETALASAHIDWAQEADEDRPTCPNGGTALQACEKRKRALQGRGGHLINVSRS